MQPSLSTLYKILEVLDSPSETPQHQVPLLTCAGPGSVDVMVGHLLGGLTIEENSLHTHTHTPHTHTQQKLPQALNRNPKPSLNPQQKRPKSPTPRNPNPKHKTPKLKKTGQKAQPPKNLPQTLTPKVPKKKRGHSPTPPPLFVCWVLKEAVEPAKRFQPFREARSPREPNTP